VPPRTPRQRVRKSPEQRRGEILAAAQEVFGRRGYRQGSLKDIADVVGLSVQGVLHHFSTKEELLLELLEERNVRRAEVMERIRTEQGAVAQFRFILLENLENPDYMRLFVTLAAEATEPGHPAESYFHERYVRTLEGVRETLEADVAAGRAPTDLEVGAAAQSLIALCDGLQLQKLHRPDLDLLAVYDAATSDMRA